MMRRLQRVLLSYSAIATLATLATCSNVRAEGLRIAGVHVESVGVHLVSQHYPDKGQNNANPGLYLRDPQGWVLGGYWNSQRRASWYFGRDIELIGPLGMRVAAVTGYKMGRVMPMVAFCVNVGAGFRLSYVPPLDKAASVIHLSYEWGFGS